MTRLTTARVECPHEADVLTAVSTRRWPDRAAPDLVAHAATCPICADVVTVASAFEADLDQAPAAPRLPDAGLVWWHAQVRARAEAARVAVRPITFAQAVGLAAFVGVVGAVFGATATWFQHAVVGLWGGVRSWLSFTPPDLPQTVVSLVATHSVLVAGAVVCILLAPIAVYLTVRED